MIDGFRVINYNYRAGYVGYGHYIEKLSDGSGVYLVWKKEDCDFSSKFGVEPLRDHVAEFNNLADAKSWCREHSPLGKKVEEFPLW